MSHDPDPNSTSKITVSWDDLQTRKVEQRLREQDALARNRTYAAMDETMVTTPESRVSGAAALWRNTIFSLALFGFIGGLLAWGCGALLDFKADLQANATERLEGLKNLAVQYERDLAAGPNSGRLGESDSDYSITQALMLGKEENAYFKSAVPRLEAEIRLRQLNAIASAEKAGTLSADKASSARSRIQSDQRDNVYFAVMTDSKLPQTEQDARLASMDKERVEALATMADRDKTKAFVGNILAFGVRGVILAVLLAIAIPLTENNVPAVIINASVGAALGLLGGVASAFVVFKIQSAVAGAPPESRQQFLATVATWGVMGLFLTLAPGVIMRNSKKLFIGLVGGLIGGLIGGVLFEPIKEWELFGDGTRFPELVAMVAIGLLAGLATGLIEDAAKTGWVKVVQGLIAGKQFILYRNPTFIGAGADCQIYLFKDPKVGRRHAAIHIVPGGYEIEDLPLGAATMVNGKPVKRTRLKNGDRVQIGATQLVFMEKNQSGG